VRNLVGTFVDVGRDRTSVEALPSILSALSRTAAGPTAPPQGLFLVEVNYDSPRESR
jgi:tRNA pseudouridine38-40 synthase